MMGTWGIRGKVIEGIMGPSASEARLIEKCSCWVIDSVGVRVRYGALMAVMRGSEERERSLVSGGLSSPAPSE